MITRMWSALQAVAEYGAVTGQAVGGAGGQSGAANLTAWAADHRMALVAAVAGLALFMMVRGSMRRR